MVVTLVIQYSAGQVLTMFIKHQYHQSLTDNGHIQNMIVRLVITVLSWVGGSQDFVVLPVSFHHCFKGKCCKYQCSMTISNEKIPPA